MTTTLLSTLIAAAVAIAATAEPRAADGAQTAASKKCEIMQRRIAKEQKSLASFDETIAAEPASRMRMLRGFERRDYHRPRGYPG